MIPKIEKTSFKRQRPSILKSIVTKHIKVGLEGDGETARKCREFVTNIFFEGVGAQSAGACVGLSSPSVFGSLTELPPELKARVLAELGGPRDDTPREDEDQCL
ncbi:MAG: hypothetical protein QGH60_19165 [Phycisphaerae bacterium]|nr:hypothetical protein [Phycisphaerae bacterium]